MATALSDAHDPDTCALCTTRHSRSRPSFCLCKHCNIPLCLECMNKHHDDILQTVGELSHSYNELRELLRTKQQMITDESKKAVDDVNSYFDSFVDALRVAQRKIVSEVQGTQKQMDEVNAEIDLIGCEIGALAKENVAQTTRMAELSAQIKRMEAKLHGYGMVKSEDLIRAIPKMSIKFSYPTEMTVVSQLLDDTERNKGCQTDTFESSKPMNVSNAAAPPFQPAFATVQFCTPEAIVPTIQVPRAVQSNHAARRSYVRTANAVHCMASDGQDILYTVYDDDQPDLIVYSTIVNNETERVIYSRDWKQSRIDDMIWWRRIQRFVCATKHGIYTVEYVNEKLKIECVLRGSFPETRMAANDTNLFAHCVHDDEGKDVIEIYSTAFRLVSAVRGSEQQQLITSVSICATNNLLASICTRRQQHREVFQVNFFDLSVKQLNWLPLGACDDKIEIRTDGNDRFFITTGRRRIYIVSSNGLKQTIELEIDGESIAILNDRRIAVGNKDCRLQVIQY